MKQTLENKIERLINKHGLHEITRTLTDVCIGRADYFRDYWHDKAQTGQWKKAAHYIDHASTEISKLVLP